MVRLKLKIILLNKEQQFSLNSTMVRLKHVFRVILVYVILCLNSTMVRLKQFWIDEQGELSDGLNSTMVRLKQNWVRSLSNYQRVSIPLWFD